MICFFILMVGTYVQPQTHWCATLRGNVKTQQAANQNRLVGF